VRMACMACTSAGQHATHAWRSLPRVRRLACAPHRLRSPRPPITLRRHVAVTAKGAVRQPPRALQQPSW
jgi:hypothetical protein